MSELFFTKLNYFLVLVSHLCVTLQSQDVPANNGGEHSTFASYADIGYDQSLDLSFILRLERIGLMIPMAWFIQMVNGTCIFNMLQFKIILGQNLGEVQ